MYLYVAVISSIYLTNIYWRIYCILDSDVGTGDVAINKRCYEIPFFMEFTDNMGGGRGRL